MFIHTSCGLSGLGNCANEVWFLVLCFRLRGILGWLQSSRLCMYLPSRLSFSPPTPLVYSPLVVFSFSLSEDQNDRRRISPPSPRLLARSLVRVALLTTRKTYLPQSNPIRVMQKEREKFGFANMLYFSHSAETSTPASRGSRSDRGRSRFFWSMSMGNRFLRMPLTR